jgi:gluconate 2-dehydrogenase gamma chain
MAESVIGRRRSLKYLALLASTAAGRDFLSGWLPAAAPASREAAAMPGRASRAPYSLQFFQPEEFRAVEALTELVIPTDETPGAREARVAEYIDFVVAAAAEFEPELQKEWAEGLALLDRLSRQQHARPFPELARREQEELLNAMSAPERDPQARHPGYAFYRRVKEMTVEGFYSSRVGLLDVLGYKGLTFLSEFPGCTHPEHQA